MPRKQRRCKNNPGLYGFVDSVEKLAGKLSPVLAGIAGLLLGMYFGSMSCSTSAVQADQPPIPPGHRNLNLDMMPV